MAAWRTRTLTCALSFRLEINASLRGLSEHLRLTAHWMFRSCHFVDKIYWITLVRFFGIIVSYLWFFFILCLLNVASTELIILLNSWCLMIINGFWFRAPHSHTTWILKDPWMTLFDVTRPVWMNLLVIHGNHQREKSLSGEQILCVHTVALCPPPPYHILFSSCHLL